ncbi:YSIRK signal domain/LPXTG anchor domain surface protein [Limosilactobacillus reuteri]|uniref:YSIRK signal domain/LPXTG anchor domain surface protein n=1 Tax=Limosilactobacillus reuteri TaxID=1598 RepID=A0A256VF29_LIMRT|nr:DUF1542 domain-containing protein [Limosilactobacillus reuteri]OYS69542.1 YSIRK signal domain/LPXTG anchor domain surface protein [Limosilactobacillus reuteri]OYS72782.1 YSIRK signal domain/LPXTG anchor domain surface protein [Limosilactobacillus reuteri]OYS75575.1 YSIRK signal domain/LPXTG anchor domain surface protein [Limosilactobacillus reuteri]OYS87857.1 YSIRK signal domain/LPXTG anchor domain surface protein [Limosilactobacillus reuteri]OYT02097.1 YSIRK signal domain/LPXTG anchor doma
MVSKNNKKLIAEKNRRNEKQRFAIRKLNIGVASVLLGITFSIYGGGQAVAHADTANASDQVAASDTGDNSLADKSEVALSNTALNASQSSTSATSANGAVQSQSSANSQPAATASDNAVASSAAVEATKDQSTAENQPSASQEVQTPAQAQPVVQENGSGDTSLDATRQVLNAVARRNSNSAGAIHLTSFAAVPASTPAVATSDATAEDTNAVTVTDAQGLIDAIQKGSATTINVANDINLAKVTDSNYTYIRKINTRDFTIKSATNGVKHTIDFSGYVFNMSTPNTVTFKDLDIYARSYWGVVYNAGGYVYDNVNFTGSQLIYTASNTDATVTFKNKVTATTVGSYTSPIDGKSRSSQGGDTQQILQFEGGTNQIIFDENSDVTLGTTNSNVLEVDRGTATIDVKNGANVTINPHSKGNPENRNGIGTGSIARAIASNANTTINVDKGANLTINTEKASGDSDVAGALYLNSDATLNVNGDLNINSTGTPSTKNDGYPVYIAGNAAINVGNGGKFNLSATNTGSYNDNLMSISGKGTVKLAPHSNFKISGDGTGALTAINLSSGSTFTSDQPDLFTIDLSANTSTGKSLIKNGTIHFTRVKTVTDGNESQPLGKIDVTYDRNGNATSYTITAQDENTVKQVGEGLANKNLIDLVKAGEDVTLSNLHLSKNNVLTGTVASSGSNNPVYVTVTVGGVSTNVPVAGNYTVYTNTNGTVTSNNVDYAAQTASTGGNFSIDLSKLASSLTDDAQVAVNATKDFVEAAQTESVAALRALNTTTLQELVDDAPTEEAKPSYYNATTEAQKAYIDAISTGKDILANPNNYDQVDVDDAVNAIQTAQKALTGKETNKTELQDAIDQASTVESSNNYTNADSNLQKAYTDAISAGQTVLSNDNATQTEVDNALTTINNAKDALNGDAKKAASKEALQKAVAEAPTVKSDDAAYYNGSDEAKAAYDKAISDGQTVLDNSDATATQITDALNAINTAKGNLKGEATDKSVLQKVVDNSATVKESNNYTNADETQKTAYDNAVTAAQTVLDKTNATQAEVNQALQDLETANNNLNGDAKTEAANKAALEAAVKDAPNVRNTPAYYNGSKEAQTAYNNAINAGQAVLNETNPFASDVKNALDAINAAKDNLKGETTSTEALETALTNANNAKETGNYANADQANQEALNNAINAGQEILKNTNATQAEVDNAAKAITDAINGLNGDTNLANAKNAATEDIQKALDTKTTEITDATNIDQATKDQLIADAKKAAEDANTAINQATNANAVNTAKTEGITKINNVKIPSLDDAKTNAAKEIDQALTDKTKEITDAENIDQTTKDQLIKEATDAATTAKDAIEKSTTNDEATKAGQAGVDAINNVKVPSVTDSQNAAKDAIDDALNAKTKEINDANNIDQTTKDQLIKEATDAANNAKEAIDKATTADAIKTVQDEGTTNINNVTVPSLEDAKKAANKAVDDALTAQTEVINKADNLSDAEKKDLIDQATNEANKAKDNIETATTNNEATKAGQAGVDAIKKIVPTSLDTVKSDANKAIDDALTKKLEEINSANALTTDEKNALTQEANTAADKAKKEITKATTNDSVIEAQNNGVTAIDGIKVPTESAVKEAAKKAVAEAAEAKNNAINASNLTAEEKAALKQKVTEAENAADQAIDNATTNAAVTEAQNNGIKAINGIEVTTSTAKEAAKKAVAEAATAKNNAIDSSNLTAEEKAALKQEVTEAQNAADQAIDNATTNAAVTEAQNSGVNAINGIKVPITSTTKEQATTDLNKAVDEAKKAIDQDSNLTDKEKQAVKDQIDSDAKTAQDAINNAKTNDDVKKAVDAGTLVIDKDVANAAIDNAVAGKKAEISNSPLTDEEKTALNNEVDQKANTAKEAINAATTPEAVTSAQDNGIKNINDTEVSSESTTKQAAKEAVAKAVDEKNAAIDSSNLTAEEKAALKQKVTEAQNAADQAIDNATTNAAVTEAKNNGVSAIDHIKVPTTSANKEKAITDLNTAVDEAKKAIDQDSNLTDEEKRAAKDQIDAAAKTAQEAINNAKTNDDVKKAVDAGTLVIDKDVANAAIDNAVAGKLKEIQDPLTTDEKQAYTDLINSEANNAKQNIANATTVEEVTTAQNSGVDAINKIEVPITSTVKDDAIKAIDKALQNKTDEINNASNINPQEKTDLINQATEAANVAKNNINNATTNADVDTAQTNGEKAIADVTVPNLSDVKKESIDLVNKALDAKTAEINNASNLSQDEKQSLINDATNAATEAINNINESQTNDDAKAAATTGVQNIENVTIPTLDDAKKNANQAIDDALNSKVNEINNASNLNDTEKQKLVDQATEAATTAKNNVENATTNDAARDAANAGIDNIKGIRFTSLEDAKKVANTAIDNALQVKTDEINNASNLSTEEKQDLINQASEAAKNAKDNINNATTNDAVTDAQNKGIADIANVTVPSLAQAKQDAINAIKQVQDAKNKQISATSNLSAKEQKELSDQVDKIANDAIAKINDAATTTNDAVTAIRDDAIKQITDLFIPTLDGAQTDALNAIESAKNAKLNDINNAVHLTDQEKQALVDQTNKAADEATKAINAAQTNDEVKSAETAGLDIINNITIPTLVQKQQEAIEELNAARDAKNSAIDNAADLTTDEKNSLKDKVQAEYSNAVSNITSATTDEAVTTAKENGIAAIKDIQIPTKSAAKEQATTDLNTAVDDAKKAIDQDSNLTDEEKQAAKDQIDSDAKKAQEAIDNAKTDDEVNSAVDNGKLAIDKDIANAAIDNAAAGKKAEIAKSPLTDEEKTALNNKVAQKAQDAKEAINDATTPEAVTTAQENGIKKINDTEVPTESAAKEAAKKAVAEAAETKNNAIDSSNLTNEEKTALKQEVTDAQNAANTAIDNATTNAAVTEAEDNGIKAINGIEVPTKSAAKEQATTDLNDAVDDAKKAIDQDSNLTDEEKQAAKDQIDSDAKKAQEVIDNAKTADEVKTAVDNGQLAIDKDVANAAIDNAVAGKKAEIAKAPLTTDEAKALNDLVDQEAKAAKKAIDSATTIPAVEDAKNTGVAAINDIAVPTTSSTKDQANQTIDDALANKTKEINDATNLSNKQKQDLIDEATEEAAKAKENIKNATSNEAVNKATTDGVDAIANVTVPSLDDAKKDASQLIDDVLKQKEAEINNASHLTDQEKQDLIHQAQNAADEAKDKINQATTNDDVATERDAGAEKIANIAVPSLDDAKDKATKAIDDALADKTKEINEQTHLSDQEKNDLIKQITDIADNAKDKINNDSNDAEVAKDEKEGIDAIVDTKVPGLEDHKQNAIKSLDEAKSTKLAQIDEAGHLTADEKANLTQQVDAEYNKALDNINKATTNDDADKASADGVEAILNIAVPSLNEKKQDSIDALNEVRDAKKEEINNANNLNQDEKDELTKQVDQIADNAINAINGAKDDQTAKNAENKGIQDILDVKVPSLDEVKTNAKQAIADALESKTNEINAASNLDSATKQELINRANAEADTAIEKIDQATSNDQALAASQAGVDKILGIEVPTLADAKQSAIDAINDALKQKETEINNALQLTSDEKQNLINQVNSIADNAKNAINNATTNQSVEETKNAGIEKINAINVPTTSATKDEAIKAIDDALTNKVNEINNATNITADEKANLIDEANNAANTAKDNITKATSDSEVATATTDGINAIANVTVPSLETAKDQAKNLIDDVLNEKKNEINNADNLSNSQKQDLINQATDEADQAKKNIDNATTNNDVQTAEDNGAQAIENVTVPSLDEAKKASTKVIDEVLKEKTAEINAATNLSNTEKDALIKDATTAANTAKDNIAKATTNDAVKDAETDGVKAILDIKVPGREDQQKDAIAALDRALADKVSEIDNANNLSETTKQDLKQQAQAAYTTAVDNVNNAQTSAEINAARDNGVQAILDITVPTLTDAQDASITAVEQVRDAKKTQIEAAKNLTETQKEALKNQVDKIADKAIDNIKNATTDATVKDAETAGINEILNVTIPTLDAAKSDAKQAIADALTAKTAEINAAQNLTDAEKQKLIDQAQTEAAAANKNIDAATTNDAAELAAKNGVQAILDIQVPTVEETRDQAKKNVDNALNSKKEEINNSNLSPAAKEALINEAEQAAENARTAIDNATTASAIGEAEAAGIAAIENIKVSNASTESDNSSNHQTNTETPTEGNSASQDNNNATQAPVQGNNTQADLTGSHGTNLTIGQQTEKAADTNSKETLPQTGNETERGLSIAGLAIASLLGLFGLSGLGKKRD